MEKTQALAFLPSGFANVIIHNNQLCGSTDIRTRQERDGRFIARSKNADDSRVRFGRRLQKDNEETQYGL